MLPGPLGGLPGSATFSRGGLPGLWCPLVNSQGLVPRVHHLLPPTFTQNQGHATRRARTQIHKDLYLPKSLGKES